MVKINDKEATRIKHWKVVVKMTKKQQELSIARLWSKMTKKQQELSNGSIDEFVVVKETKKQ